MLRTNANGKVSLAIFDGIQIDYSLPKFNSNDNLVSEGDVDSFTPMDSNFITGSDSNISLENVIVQNSSGSWTVQGVATTTTKKTNIYHQFMGLFKNLIPKSKLEEKTVKYNLSVEEFFKSIKNSTNELVAITGRAKSYEGLLNQATQFGQIALVEKLKRNIELIKTESQLYSIGLRTILTEDVVVNFAQQSDKGIRLDYIKNFVRIIPPSILEIKSKVDGLGLFDNYVIMHYDPDGNATEMTEEEIERARDPILFGVIKGSNKLYYVGDWVDDYCDLTLDKIVEEIGEDGIDENRLSVNIKIEKL